MKKVFYCATCSHLKLLKSPQATRYDCMCEHPDVLEVFNRACPKAVAMSGFISYTAKYSITPTIKTSPRWCPLKHGGEVSDGN